MNKPWYNEPFVWLLILFPASAVIGGIITIILAINSNDGLVVDDYYKQGLEINRTLERDKAAARHGLVAALHLNIERHLVYLNLNAHSDYKLPNQIIFTFQYHTRSGFDKTLKLERSGDNFYQGRLPELIVGKWYVQIMADDWRLLESVQMPLTQDLELKPLLR